MSVGERVKRGFKKLPGLDDDESVSLDELIAHHGLMELVHIMGTPRIEENIRDCIWHEAMDKLPERRPGLYRGHCCAAARSSMGCLAFTVSTIHGSKGGEADNVVLFTDLSPCGRCRHAAEQSPDDLFTGCFMWV